MASTSPFRTETIKSTSNAVTTEQQLETAVSDQAETNNTTKHETDVRRTLTTAPVVLQEHTSSQSVASLPPKQTNETNAIARRHGEARRDFVSTDKKEKGNPYLSFYFDEPTSFVLVSIIVLLAGIAIGILIRAGIAAGSEYRQRWNERQVESLFYL